jgi:hypothetical protein
MKTGRKRRQVFLTMVVAVLIYMGSYCCLSACGGYQFRQSGRVRYGFGLSVSDVSIWQPKFLRWQRFTNTRGEEVIRGNIFGYLFCPLIVVDRWLIHPTERVL